MYCIVQNCKSVWTPNSGIKFHSFPKDDDRRNTWLTSIRVKSKFYSSAKICSLHFKTEDYDPKMEGKLVNSAVPYFSSHPLETTATFVEFCMICLDPHRKLYQASKYHLDSEYEHLTGISLGDVVNFTPMFCSECAQRLVNCCKFRDKSLRAFQLLSELLHNNAELSPQTLSSVDRARCRLTSSLAKKTFEPDHCDLYVTEDTESIDKVYMKNVKNDLHEKLNLKYETNLDPDLESGNICDDAAEFMADDNTDVDITNDDANDGVDVVYIDDSSNDDLYNHEDNMHGVEQSNTNVRSHKNQLKTLNRNTTTAIPKADAKWLNNIDIDCDMKKDMRQAATCVEKVKSMPTYSNVIEDNKDVLSKNVDSTKYIAVGDDILNKEAVKDENDELSDYYEEIGVISLDDDIGYNIHHGIETVKKDNEYDNYVKFVNENISNPDKVNGAKAVAKTIKNNDVNNIVSLNNVLLVRETDKRSVSKGTNANATQVLVNMTKSNDVNNIVSENNVILVRETDKRSVSNGIHATTLVSVKKRAAKRKQPPSDEKKPPKKRGRKKIIPPQKTEEPKCEKIKWFKRIERTPEEQIYDWTQREERYRDTRYKCTDCYKSFNFEKTYKLHMEKHTDKYGPIECHICRVRVKSRRYLTEHHWRTHKFLYRCTKCDFVTNTGETATSHSHWHDGKTYECPHCGKVFTKRSTYYGHVRFAHPSDTVCALCGYSFVSKRGLWMHQKKGHRDDTQELSGPQCEQCDVRFASEAAYETHLQVSPKHGAPGDILKRNDASLGILGKSCRPREKRKAELDLPSEEGTRRRRTNKKCVIDCELCNAVLENRNKYYWHLRNYHPDSVKPPKRDFMCEQCGKLCINKFHLQEHTLRHGSPKVQCDTCNKKFYSAKALRFHVLRTHNAAQSRGDTYMCAHCAYQTKERGNLRRHMQIHLDSDARRWFQCTVCGKKTTTRQALQDHVLHVHQKVPWPARVRASRPRAVVPRARDTDSSEL